jgi:hypothetical protein
VAPTTRDTSKMRNDISFLLWAIVNLGYRKNTDIVNSDPLPRKLLSHLDTEEENLKQLNDNLRNFLDKRLPLFKMLKVIP